MADKYEMFMNCSKISFIGICKKKYECQTCNTKRIMHVKEKNIAYKCKIFEAVNLTLHRH